MTNEQVHALARRVGFPMQNPDWQKAVEEFAALCCEAEREECIAVCIGIATAPSNCTLGVALNCAEAIRARGNP